MEKKPNKIRHNIEAMVRGRSLPGMLEMLAFLKTTELHVFNQVAYPEIINNDRHEQSFIDRDEAFIEGLFMDIYSFLKNNHHYQIKKVVRKYERDYIVGYRYYRMKKWDDFYRDAIHTAFFAIYEANSSFLNPVFTQQYLNRFKDPDISK